MPNRIFKFIKQFFQKILLFTKQNYKILIFSLFLTFINIFFLFQNFKLNSLKIGNTFIFLLIVSILLELSLCLIIFYAQKNHWKIEKLFLVLFLIIGSFYTLAIPVGRAPDEVSHFYRIYEITEGHFVSDISENGDSAGSLEPENISIVKDFSGNNTYINYYDIFEKLGTQANSEKVFLSTSADGYNIISYLPQVTGMFIGKIFQLPFLISAYLAKFANLIFCAIILYFSIKYIPFLKKIIFVIAFLPISMQAMTSLSSDAPIIVTAISLISFILYATYSMKTTFTKKHYFLIFSICLFLCITKIVYAPLCLLLFTIPKERFGKLNRKIISILSIGALISVFYLLWNFMIPPLRTVSDSSAQINLILQNPLKYIGILFNSISTNFLLYFSGILGGDLEWFDVHPPMIYLISFYTIFVLLCSKECKSARINKTFKILSIFLSILVVILIFTAMFIAWTKVGENIIDGVQGRYLLPLLILIPTWFIPVSKDGKQRTKVTVQNSFIEKNRQDYYLYSFVIFESICSILTIACSHL